MDAAASVRSRASDRSTSLEIEHRGTFEPNNTLEVELRFIIFSALALMCQIAKAETVQVKYHGMNSRTLQCAAKTDVYPVWLFHACWKTARPLLY